MIKLRTRGTYGQINKLAIQKADLRCVYVYGLAGDDVPVCKGNTWIWPHFIGTSKDPDRLAKGYGLRQIWKSGIVEEFWCIGPPVASRVLAETERRLIASGLRKSETGRWNTQRETLFATIRMAAKTVGVTVMTARERITFIEKVADQITGTRL